MKPIITYTVLLLITVQTLAAQTLEDQNFIRVDQFGYLPETFKVAVIAKAEEGFNAGSGIDLDATKEIELRDLQTDDIVFSALAHEWNGGTIDEYSGDKGWWFDFTAFETPGAYYIRAYKQKGIQSIVMLLRSVRMFMSVCYKQPLTCSTTSASTSKKPEHTPQDQTGRMMNGIFKDQHAIYLNDESQLRDISRGWIDAGDPNKYVTFASEAVHHLLTTYQQYPELWDNLELNIPESGNSIPDLLDEIKWEIDWLKTMQDYPGSGGFHIKSGIRNDGNYISPPSTDDRDRYYDEICPSASIIGAGMLAHVAMVFSNIPELKAYTQDLIPRAEAGWKYYTKAADKEQQCDGGEIEAGDADGGDGHYGKEHLANATTAAVYLYAVTGKNVYNEFIKANYTKTRPWNSGEWGIYRSEQSEAVLHYTTLMNADEAVSNDILAKKMSAEKSAGTHYEVIESDNLYRAKVFYSNWGSNSLLSRQASDNMDFIYYDLLPDNHNNYLERAQSAVSYFHGTNPLGITYLTNMYEFGAEFSVTEMWHTWFATNTIYDNLDGTNVGPAPGYLVGGFNSKMHLTLK